MILFAGRQLVAQLKRITVWPQLDDRQWIRRLFVPEKSAANVCDKD